MPHGTGTVKDDGDPGARMMGGNTWIGIISPDKGGKDLDFENHDHLKKGTRVSYEHESGSSRATDVRPIS